MFHDLFRRYYWDFVDIHWLIWIEIYVLSLSVIESKSIVMKYNYVIHLKHSLILMLKVLFASQQSSVVLKQITVLYGKQYVQ